MPRMLRAVSAVGLLFASLATTVRAQDEMVANPYYEFWADTKPGAKVVLLEQTKLGGPEAKLAVADGVDEKRIAYELVEVTPDRAVVEMVVTERDFLGYVQAAPTRYHYPAKLKKSHLERLLKQKGAAGEETVTAAGKEWKCRTVTGVVEGPGGEQIEYKLWLSDQVPGSIVKQVRTARQKGELIAETTITLQAGE